MIPITFTFQDKEYSGFFSHVNGAGSTATYFLTVDKFHIGQLFLTENYGWQFHSNRYPEMTELSDFFGEYVTLWHE